MLKNKMVEDISILIVEDESELLAYLQEYLQIFFKNVYVARCGESGYEMYLKKRPDIILSDINMPNMDGLCMIKKIREHDNDTDIIIMSAHSEQDKLFKAIELRLVTYLIKPIDSHKLKTMLLKIVNRLRESKKRIYIKDNLFWDKATFTLWKDTEQILLKEKELKLFKFLFSRINTACTSEEIFLCIYGEDTKKEFSQYAITSFIKRLRVKLPEGTIQNEYGEGYKIVSKEMNT